MCCLDTGETLAPMIGATLKEYYHSSEKMCELEEYIYETFHSDGAGSILYTSRNGGGHGSNS